MEARFPYPCALAAGQAQQLAARTLLEGALFWSRSPCSLRSAS